MEPFALVNHAIEALTPYLPAVADVGMRVGEDAAAHALYEVIARTVRSRGEGNALAQFISNPVNNSQVKRVLRQAIRDDHEFAAELAEAVAALAPQAATNSVYQVGNVVGRDMAGRDIVRNTTTTSTTHNKKTNTGGLVLGLVLIVAVIAACLVGRALLNSTTAGGLTGNSTCQDFLASADTAAKAEVMKRLYLADNKPHLAADPFMIQNTEYFCGNSPNMTLARLASVRNDE